MKINFSNCIHYLNNLALLIELFAKSPPIWRGLLQKSFDKKNYRKVSWSSETPTHATRLFQIQAILVTACAAVRSRAS